MAGVLTIAYMLRISGPFMGVFLLLAARASAGLGVEVAKSSALLIVFARENSSNGQKGVAFGSTSTQEVSEGLRALGTVCRFLYGQEDLYSPLSAPVRPSISHHAQGIVTFPPAKSFFHDCRGNSSLLWWWLLSTDNTRGRLITYNPK